LVVEKKFFLTNAIAVVQHFDSTVKNLVVSKPAPGTVDRIFLIFFVDLENMATAMESDRAE
jgi:hypothetical protein